MFAFLKDKLKAVLRKISDRAEKESVEEEKHVSLKTSSEQQASSPKPKKSRKKTTTKKQSTSPSLSSIAPPQSTPSEQPPTSEKPVEQQNEGFFRRLFTKKTEEPSESLSPPTPEPPEKKGVFARLKERITTTTISSEKFDVLFEDLELVLLENNVAYEVIDKLRSDLRSTLVDKPIKRGSVLTVIRDRLRDSIRTILTAGPFDLAAAITSSSDKPYVIVFVGVNGSGKTTTISKVAHSLKQQGFSCVLVAGDTWRAASIQQLEQHGTNLGLKVIKHDYGSDPAAVAYDGIQYAKTHHIDVVLIDTAGRQHSNANLMSEMEKIIRVSRPHLKIFVGEALVGNDAVEQARSFNDSIGIDGIILTKADVDEKGGAFLSVSYVTNKPVIYWGSGQKYQDLHPFNADEILERIGLSSSD